MNFTLFATTLLLLFSLMSNAQTMRYFEFRTLACGHGKWQDTSFIAAASDSILIEKVLIEIEKPIEQRQHINGKIEYSDGGYNRNSTHKFTWHFIPDKWGLAEMSVEVCDGCPFSDIDNSTSYWVDTVGHFCPWSSKPIREIFQTPVTVNEIDEESVSIYPNPTNHGVYIQGDRDVNTLHISIQNIVGNIIFEESYSTNHIALDVSQYPINPYFISIRSGSKKISKVLIISR
ncbi:MAG: T9SS type A sorting domain-containing protein [Candidatus Kapaibacterium sp.]|jgi:hypothetical protein